MTISPLPTTGLNHLPRAAPALRMAQSIESRDMEAALTGMKARFLLDFISGDLGTRYNTYAHRMRIIGQMTAELARVRAGALGTAA